MSIMDDIKNDQNNEHQPVRNLNQALQIVNANLI